jgi:hypothetical protein
MNPVEFLLTILLITVLAMILNEVRRRVRRRALRDLGAQWGMIYSPTDHLLLQQRIGGAFPIPGLANIVIEDVLYGVEEGRRRYIFTAQYTRGVIRRKKRISHAVSCHETCDGSALSPLVLAPVELPIVEQYRWLHDRSE